MRGAQGAESRPVPDPTSLTTDALHREVDLLRGLIEARMGSEQVRLNEHLAMMERQRTELKNDNAAAVAAAFSASEHAIATTANTLKESSAATYVSLGQLQSRLNDLMPRSEAETRTQALTLVIADLKDRVVRMESVKQGGKEAFTSLQVFLAIIVALIVIGGSVFAAQGVAP